ncbi:MAG: glycosyltransferase [Deltaproteobacteria bacterium]|nr:glycosyltransferase [Deltaproteobacteria bacterium]MCL5278254.1 glycosyltransferase [Deltaproteobacteria bacterium]
MKVLQINKFYYPVIGGIETVVRQIAEGINARDGLTVDVLACSNGPGASSEDINGVHVTRARSMGVLLSMPVSVDFVRALKEMHSGYDLLHLHLPFPLGELALWLVRPESKLVVTYHSDIVRQRLASSAMGWLHRWTLERAQRIVVSNPNIVRTSAVLRGFRPKCTVIPFGVDTARFGPGGGSLHRVEQIRRRYGQKIVLFVGRLVYYKGVEYLIRAMKDIDAGLVIIGEGPLKDRLAGEARRIGLGDRVSFVPYRTPDELADFYLAASVFVLPSVYRSEAFGITIAEAMACGLPVISTELGTGTSYVNQEGVTGFVLPPRDSGAINDRLKRLLSDSALSAAMGRAAAGRIKAGFTLDSMLYSHEMLYGSCI